MTPQALTQLLPLVLILVVFYLLIMRPARSRQRETLALQQRLAVGQRVVTTAGLYATVSALEDDQVELETSPGVTSRWVRASVARVLDPDSPPTSSSPAASDTPESR